MSKFANLPIRMQLLALAILLTLPVLGIILYSAVKARSEDYRRAEVESQKLADSLADRQVNLITQAQQLGGLLADLPEVKTRNKSKVQSLLSVIHKRNRQYQSILITDKAGQVWASSIPLAENISLAGRRYFQSARATRRFSSGEFAVHMVLNKPTISMAYPLSEADGDFDGVIVLSFDLDVLRSILQRSQLPNDTNYLLVDHKGIILSRAGDSGQVVGRPIMTAVLQQMQQGPDRYTHEFVRYDGDKRITTYRNLRLAGEPTPYMYVRASISSKEALSQGKRDLFYNLAILSPFVCCAFLLALLIGKRSISDRVAKLQTASQQIAGGDLTTRVAHLVEGGELGELGRAFDEMAVKLALDVSERSRAEELLHKKEERLRVIFEASLAGIVMVDPNGVIEFANGRMAAMFGCSMEELVGSAYADYLHQSQQQTGKVRMHQLVSGQIEHIQSERLYLRKDGSDFWGYLSARRLESPDGRLQAVIGIIADITDRKQAQEKLRQSEEKFSAAFKISPDSISMNTFDDKIFLEVNESFTSMLGYSEQEVLGKTADSLGIWVDPADGARLASLLGDYGSVKNLEARMRCKDETVITVLISSRLVEIDGRACTLNISRDITEREKDRSERLKMQKLESLGLLAGGIAHDFNNILTGIMGNISLARMVIDPAHEAHTSLAKSEKASLRAADLAKQLLVFAKGGQPIKKPVSLQGVVEEAASLALSGTTVKGVLDIPVPLHTVEVDEGQMNQSFHNIIVNAVHAMPAGGILTIRGENVRLEEGSLRGLGGGDHVMVAFTDEGCGISEKDQKKIFDPYFTTKPGGTGLGLASTHAIVNKHGGQIFVDSALAKGTTFTLYLPSTGRIQAAQNQQSDVVKFSRNEGHVLVMDDEEMVRDLACLMLRRTGYTVEACINGEEAVSLYHSAKTNGTPFSMVIMDLTIPGGMGGVEAAQCILTLDPEACLIVSSGYSEDPVMANYQAYGFSAAIAKPYTVTTIAGILAGLASDRITGG